MGPGHFWWGGFGVLQLITFIALIILILWAIRWLFRWGNAQPPDKGDSENAIDILKKRYAKGEINKEEFEQIKKDIMS